MITGRIAVLSLIVAPLCVYGSSLVSGCAGTVIRVTGDASSDTGSASSSGSGSGSSSGVISSSSSSSGSGSSSGVSNSSGADQCSNLPPGACQQPPPVPTAPSMPLQVSHNYAIHQLFLGDTDRQGVETTDAWKSLGYDLDNKITSAFSTDVCTLAPGSARAVQVDGNGGIDNSWGANIMPIILTLDSSATQAVNASLQAGAWTQMTYVNGFDDSPGNTTSAVGLTGVELAGAAYSTSGGVPSWDLATSWPAAPFDIAGCTPTAGCPAGTDPVSNALVRFPAAFQSHGTFVNGTPIPVSLPIDLGGQPLVLNIQSAVLTFQPQAPGSVTNGVIAGALATQDLIAALHQVAGRISSSLCAGSAFQSIAAQIEQTADIQLNAGTISNSPGSPCNAISIGLGFNATEIAPPTTIAPPAPTQPDPCGDGG